MGLGRTLAMALLAAAMAPAALAQSATAPAAAAPAGPATIYRVQQIILAGQPSPELMKQMQPLHTLDQVEALLKANRIAFTWREGEINSTQVPPELLRQIVSVPPHEVFVVGQAKGLIISLILDSRPAPATPPAASPSPETKPSASKPPTSKSPTAKR